MPCPRDVQLRDLPCLAWLSSECSWPCAGKCPHGLCHPDLLSSRTICGSTRAARHARGLGLPMAGTTRGSMFREGPCCWLEAAQLDPRGVSVLLPLSFAWPCQRSSCGQEAVGTEAQPCTSACHGPRCGWRCVRSPFAWLLSAMWMRWLQCHPVHCVGLSTAAPAPPGSLPGRGHVLHGSPVTIFCSSEAVPVSLLPFLCGVWSQVE